MAHLIRDLRDEYWRLLSIVDYDDWIQQQFADHLQCGLSTIKKWARDAPWDQIKAERRRRYADRTIRIDSALYRAALAGDVAAIKLWFERFDAWVPEQKISLNDQSDEALRERALQLQSLIYAERERGVGGDIPGTGEARA